MNEFRLVKTITTLWRSTVSLPHSRTIIELRRYIGFDFMTRAFESGLQDSDRSTHYRRELIVESGLLEASLLHCLDIVMSVHTANLYVLYTDDDVAESDVMLRSWRAATNANH